MISPLIQAQFDALQKEHPEARMEQGSGGMIISIPNMTLEPAGKWNKPTTTVRILAPPAFPQAKPDCFWVDQDVRLASGGLPQNAQPNSQLGSNLLWFSWHVQKWNPNVDTLQTYLRVVLNRLRQGV
jgi:hypothetical protein